MPSLITLSATHAEGGFAGVVPEDQNQDAGGGEATHKSGGRDSRYGDQLDGLQKGREREPEGGKDAAGTEDGFHEVEQAWPEMHVAPQNRLIP
jgi:hypothetical protein